MTSVRSMAACAAAAVGPPRGTLGLAAALAMTLLPPVAVSAAPVELKLSVFFTEQTDIYRYGVKPFVDAVNAEGKGLVAIKVYANGALGKGVAEQPGLVLDGKADIAWVVPGQTPYRFPDNALLEMPGLFRDLREGTLAYTRLTAAKALRGYNEFVVIGAYTTGPTFFNSRKPIGSLADLKGQKIRANNQIEAETIERLGAIPTVMPASLLAQAARRGTIDGAALVATALYDFGVAPVATNHFLLYGGVTPLVVLMSRKSFDRLPAAAQALIRKHAGAPEAAIWIESFGASERRGLARLKADPAHTVVEPSQADRAAAERVYKSVIDAWAARSSHNQELLKRVESELATIRATGR